MAEEKKGIKVTLGAVLTVLGLVGGPLAVWADLQRERGMNSEKFRQMEVEKEDLKVSLRGMRADIQTVLIKVTEIEAVQKADRRNRRDNSRD